MKTLILFTSIFLIALTSYGQEYSWFEQMGGLDDDRVQHMQLDNNGDLVVIGNFKGTSDFDPSVTVNEVTSNGAYDVFVAKYDTTGNLIWLKSFGGTSYDYGHALHIDANDNIFIGGVYGNTIDVDPGVGEVLITSAGNSSYLLKLDSNGDYQWSRNLTGDVRIKAIKTGPQGVVCAGTLIGTSEFNNEGASVELISQGATDLYVMTLTNAGVFDFIKQIGEMDHNPVSGFDIDAAGNIYLSCRFIGSIDIDPGAGITTLSANNASNYGNFIAKYNSLMELQWGKNTEFPNYSEMQNLAIAPDNGVVFNGYFSDSIRFNQFGDNTWYHSAGDNDIYIGKMDPNGALEWMKRFGNIEDDEGGRLHVAESGNIYMFYQFTGTVDSDMGPATANVTSVGTRDNYIMRLDTNGDLSWFLQDSSDFQYTPSMPSLVEGDNSEIYAIYNFYNEMELAQNGIIHSFTSSGDYDILLMQLREGNSLSLNEQKDVSYIVYPNPAQENIFVLGLQGMELNYTIQSTSGRVVKFGDTSGQIDIGDLKEGIYLLRIQNQITRFIKD